MTVTPDPKYIFANAIFVAFRNYPAKGDGTTRGDQLIQPDASVHLAEAVVTDLAQARYEVVKKRSSDLSKL